MRYICRGLLVFLVGIAAPLASADDLTTAAGKKFTGTLVAVDKDGIAFKIGGDAVKVSGKEIVLVDLGRKVVAPAKDAKYSLIELTDGSRLHCTKFAVKKKAFEVELLAGPKDVPPPVLELPLTSVFYACRGADDAKNRDEWKRMLQNRGKRDLYVIREFNGLNFVQGTLLEGNETGSHVNFEKEDGTKQELLLRAATGGLVFNQPQAAQAATTLCKVLDVFGNVLIAQAVEMSASSIAVTTVSGAVVTYPSAAGVAQLDYSRGNVAYLSDLQPKVDAIELPADEASKNVKEPYLVDKAPGNAPLKLDGVDYPKGLWIRADTALTYALGGDYREFRAVIGILDDASGDGATETAVTIEADGRVVFSETIRRKDKPKGVALDVKNVKVIRIQVESASPCDKSRQAVLADARVQK